MVDEVQSGGGIDEHEGELIRSAIEFNDLDVEDILTPRVQVVAVEERDTLEEISDKFLQNGYSRMLVYRHTIDTRWASSMKRIFTPCSMRAGWI